MRITDADEGRGLQMSGLTTLDYYNADIFQSTRVVSALIVSQEISVKVSAYPVDGSHCTLHIVSRRIDLY